MHRHSLQDPLLLTPSSLVMLTHTRVASWLVMLTLSLSHTHTSVLHACCKLVAFNSQTTPPAYYCILLHITAYYYISTTCYTLLSLCMYIYMIYNVNRREYT